MKPETSTPAPSPPKHRAPRRLPPWFLLAAAGAVTLVVLLALLAALGDQRLLRTQLTAVPAPEPSSEPNPRETAPASGGDARITELTATGVTARMVIPVTMPLGCAGGTCTYDAGSEFYTAAEAERTTGEWSDLAIDQLPLPEANPLADTPEWSEGSATLSFSVKEEKGATVTLQILDYPMRFESCSSTAPGGIVFPTGTFPTSGKVTGHAEPGNHQIICRYYTDLVPPELAEPPYNTFTVQAEVTPERAVTIQSSGTAGGSVAGAELQKRTVTATANKPKPMRLPWDLRPGQKGTYEIVRKEKLIPQTGGTPEEAYRNHRRLGLSECTNSIWPSGVGLGCLAGGTWELGTSRHASFAYGVWNKNKDGKLDGSVTCMLTAREVEYEDADGKWERGVLRVPFTLLGPPKFRRELTVILPVFRFPEFPNQAATLKVYTDDIRGHEDAHVKIATEKIEEDYKKGWEKDTPKQAENILKETYNLANGRFTVPEKTVTQVITLPDRNDPNVASETCNLVLKRAVIDAWKRILGRSDDAYENPLKPEKPPKLKKREQVTTIEGRAWHDNLSRVDYKRVGQLCTWLAEARPRYDSVYDEKSTEYCTDVEKAKDHWAARAWFGVFDNEWPPAYSPLGKSIRQGIPGEEEDSRIIYYRSE